MKDKISYLEIGQPKAVLQNNNNNILETNVRVDKISKTKQYLYHKTKQTNKKLAVYFNTNLKSNSPSGSCPQLQTKASHLAFCGHNLEHSTPDRGLASDIRRCWMVGNLKCSLEIRFVYPDFKT